LCKIYGVAEGGNINFNNNILNNQNINKIENELKAPVSYKTPASYILNAMCAILAAERQYFKVYKDLLKCDENKKEETERLVKKALEDWEKMILKQEGRHAIEILFNGEAKLMKGFENLWGLTEPIVKGGDCLQEENSKGVSILQKFVQIKTKNEKPSELMEFFNELCEKMQDPKVFFEKGYDIFAAKAEGLDNGFQKEKEIFENKIFKNKINFENKLSEEKKKLEEIEKEKLEAKILPEETYAPKKNIGDEEFIKYVKEHPGLKDVDIQDCKWLSSEAIEALAENCKGLRCLKISTKARSELGRDAFFVKNLLILGGAVGSGTVGAGVVGAGAGGIIGLVGGPIGAAFGLLIGEFVGGIAGALATGIPIGIAVGKNEIRRWS
jgi:hypothetical protein